MKGKFVYCVYQLIMMNKYDLNSNPGIEFEIVLQAVLFPIGNAIYGPKCATVLVKTLTSASQCLD